MSDLIPKKISQLTETEDITDQYFIVDKVENGQENTQRVKLDEVLQTEIKDKITYTSNSGYPTTIGTLTTPNGDIDITIPYDNPPDTDQELDTESENAISNKAVSTALNNLSTSLSNTITTGLNQKVDKEEGKGLSTEDFTTAEKEKLAGIESDAQVNSVETINGLAPDEDTTNITIDSLLGANAAYCITTSAEENEDADIAVGIINGNVATTTEEDNTVIKEGHIFYLKVSDKVTLDDNFYIGFPSSVGLTTSSIKVSFDNKAPVWAEGDIVLLIYNNGKLQYVNNSLATTNTAGLIKLADNSNYNSENIETDTAVTPSFLNENLQPVLNNIRTLDDGLAQKADLSLVSPGFISSTNGEYTYGLNTEQDNRGLGIICPGFISNGRKDIIFSLTGPYFVGSSINIIVLGCIIRTAAGGYLSTGAGVRPFIAGHGNYIKDNNAQVEGYTFASKINNGVITIRIRHNTVFYRCTDSSKDTYPVAELTNNTPVIVDPYIKFTINN